MPLLPFAPATAPLAVALADAAPGAEAPKPKKKPFFVRRYERDIKRLEKKLAKLGAKVEKFRVKMQDGKITKAKFEMKKSDIERFQRRYSARIRTLHGAIRKEIHKGDDEDDE